MSCYNLDAYQDREIDSAYVRAAVTMDFLIQGAKLTTAEIARLSLQSTQGAASMLNNLVEGEVPIARDEFGRWHYTG